MQWGSVAQILEATPRINSGEERILDFRFGIDSTDKSRGGYHIQKFACQGERQPFDSVRCHQQRSLNGRIPWSIPGDAGAIPAVAIFFLR
ncbi:MAG: hypothetical protein EAZ33_05150 [Oscillatoriales cyanobacterium]|nr:MAG: hypothetical protein EAZ33_05150 [Oscillatoriales cyanobacterium]